MGQKPIFFLSTFLLLVVTLSYVQSDSKYRENDRNSDWEEFEEFRKWKRSKEVYEQKKAFSHDSREIEEQKPRAPENVHLQRDYGGDKSDPPPIDQAALMGRYIVNQADWTSVATISSRKETETFPFVNVISVSDGPLGNGSGIPYMYLTPLDFTAQDLMKDHRATLMMTLAQGNYCHKNSWDPMDPRCARIVLTGKIKAVKNNSMEHELAEKAIFGRHPWLAHMPADHHFFFAKLKIMTIAVLDTFGGPKFVTVRDYLHPPTPNATHSFFEYYPGMLNFGAERSRMDSLFANQMENLPFVRKV